MRWRATARLSSTTSADARSPRIVAKLEKKGFRVGAMETTKKVPRGVDPEHPRAELLKRKGLIVSFEPPLATVAKRALLAWIVERAKAAVPLVEWLTFATA